MGVSLKAVREQREKFKRLSDEVDKLFNAKVLAHKQWKAAEAAYTDKKREHGVQHEQLLEMGQEFAMSEGEEIETPALPGIEDVPETVVMPAPPELPENPWGLSVCSCVPGGGSCSYHTQRGEYFDKNGILRSQGEKKMIALEDELDF